MSNSGRGIPSPNRRDQKVIIETHARTLPYGAEAPKKDNSPPQEWHPAPPPPAPPLPMDDPAPRVPAPYRVEHRRLLLPAAAIGQEFDNLRRLMQELMRTIGALEARIDRLERRR